MVAPASGFSESDSDSAADHARDDRDLLALSVAYATAADARDGEGLAALFVEDGELVVPKFPVDLRPVLTRSGHDALVGVADMLGRYHRTFHVVSNPKFEVAEDDATGDVPCVAHHVTAAEPSTDGGAAGTDAVWFIRYRDRYRRTGPVWRIVRRELHLLWVEEHPVATLGPPTDGADGADGAD
jgi:ketosteroid isomerase-like protein